jgi:hypothetical protein
MNTLRRRQQALATGTAYNPQAVAGQQMAKSMQKNAFAAGGPVNMGMYSNLMSQTMGNISQQTSQDMAQGLAQMAQLTTGMANRKADLTLLQRNEMMADSAENQKAGFQNLAGGLMPKGKFKYNDGLKIQEILDPTKKKKKPGEVDLDVEETEEEGQG